MIEYNVSWNERVFYESTFTTDAEEGSCEWWDALREHGEWVDSNGMDDIVITCVMTEPYTL